MYKQFPILFSHTSATTPYVLREAKCTFFVLFRTYQNPYVSHPVTLRLA